MLSGTTYGLALLASAIFLWPALLYVMRYIKDPFHPLTFVGVLAFVITSGGILSKGALVLELVSESAVNIYLIVAAVSILGFYGGWWLHLLFHRKQPLSLPDQSVEYEGTRLFLWALIFDLIGVSAYLFTRQNYTATGYVYELGQLWIMGALLSIQAVLVAPRSLVACLITFAVAVIPPIDRFFIYGQRGDTFRLAMVCLPMFFFKKIRPPFAVFLPVVLAFGLVMGTLERTRAILGENAAQTRLEALGKAIPSFFEKDPAERLYGSQTYIYGPAMVQAVRHEQSYEYGAWLYNIGVRFLPKEWFDKDPLYTRWSVTNFNQTTSDDAGFSVPGGSAPSGFASVFVEFGWASPLFWMLLGYIARIRYVKALNTDDLRQHAFLTACYIIGLYLITQDLYAATMNTIYMFPAMIIAYWISRVRGVASEDAHVVLA
jgi:hypothetical protein